MGQGDKGDRETVWPPLGNHLSPCQRTVLKVKIHLARKRAAPRKRLRWALTLAERLRAAILAHAPPEDRERMLSGDPKLAPLATLWLNAEVAASQANQALAALDRADAHRQRKKADLERRVTFVLRRQSVGDEVFALAEAELRAQGKRCGRRMLHKAAWSIAGRLGFTDAQRDQITETAARHYLKTRTD